MFHYFLAFLLINTCYQSLGNPIEPGAPKQLLSKPLTTLASQCKNTFLSNQLKSKIQECAVFVPPYSKKQFQCLIFYDINMQLCNSVASSKLALDDDYLAKINEKQDVNDVCMLAKEWVFTNISDFVGYKESAEKFFKLPATCGEVCGVEDTMNEVNYYCKYYMWGLGLLKSQHVSTMANNANNNAVAAPVISEPNVDAKADIPIPVNSNPINPQDTNTKTLKKVKPTENAVVAKPTPEKVEEVIEDEVVKSDTIVQVTSKQTPSLEAAETDKNEDSDLNVNRLEDPSVALPENGITSNDHANKTSTVNIAEKTSVVNEMPVPETGKDLPVNAEQKEAVLEHPKPKAMGEPADYADAEGNDSVGDDDGEEPGLEIKSEQDINQNTFIRNKMLVPPVHDVDVSQKEYFPNTMPDDFSDDNDHFFPFFMTCIVLMVLLYVLYHNKSKVSKVFFGLILEGRQSGRRRNSRGHAYRRLDTLEQAMSANTAAPPSKIIY